MSYLPLDAMDGYVINCVPFYKMEESDWVILRLIQLYELERGNAIIYLNQKYGQSVVGSCQSEIIMEWADLTRKAQEVNNEQVPDFFFMENDLMGKR